MDMSEEISASQGDSDDPASHVRESREQAWSNYRVARIELTELRIRANLDGWPTWVHMLPGGKLERAERRLIRLGGKLSRHGVGAEERHWGPLSGGELPGTQGVMTLESTIAGLVRRYRATAPAWAAELAAIARSGPQIREAAADGDRVQVHALIQRLLTAVRLAPDEAAGEPLIRHLPGELRPIPAEVTALRRSGQPVTVAFEVRTSTIELETITITPGLRGMGLGSAELRYLCRAADEHRMRITGRLVPTYDDDSAVPTLAAWLRRHGFTVQERVGGRITREPGNPA